MHKTCQIRARITKRAPNMHPVILAASIENGGHWPWPSWSFWSFWLRNLSCPCDNFWWIRAEITKLAPNMRLENPTDGIENGGYWPWPLRSFGHFDSECQEMVKCDLYLFVILIVKWSFIKNEMNIVWNTVFCTSAIVVEWIKLAYSLFLNWISDKNYSWSLCNGLFY